MHTRQYTALIHHTASYTLPQDAAVRRVQRVRSTQLDLLLAEKNGCDLAELALGDMQNVDARITDDVYSVLSVENSVASRTSFGGTAPENVRAAARDWCAVLSDD